MTTVRSTGYQAATCPDAVIVPNCMRGFASAADICAALNTGVKRAKPRAIVLALPLADGGDGTLEVLHKALGADWRETVADDAFGVPRPARWLSLGTSAAVETADICGLSDLRPDQANPLRASSAGVGTVISEAISQGAREILLGLGGTAVADGGAGCLASLGARFIAADGRIVPPVPESIAEVGHVDLAPVKRKLAGVSLRLLSDVSTPLERSVRSFGAQKGVTAATRPLMTKALEHLADLLASADPVCGSSRLRKGLSEPWRGAGGGIGFGLSAVTAVSPCSGSDVLMSIADPQDMINKAPWAITAEGQVDASTWLGKIPGTVAEKRADHGLPTVIVAATFGSPPSSSLIKYHQITNPAPSNRRALRGLALLEEIARSAEDAFRQSSEPWECEMFSNE